MSDRHDVRVGRVLRAGTRGFTIGCAVMQPDIPAFGAFVRADGPAPQTTIFGLISDVSIEDDLFVRQFIGADTPDEVILDQRRNRQVPVEVSVLAIGCGEGDQLRHSLPAQPPVTLDWLYMCTEDEVRRFTRRLDYLRLVLEARDAPADELLAASLRAAASARPAGERDAFLVLAGRELVRLLAGDPVRLEWLLRRVSTT